MLMRYWAPLYDAVGRRIGVLDEATAGWQLAHLPEPLALEGADCFQDSCRRLHNLCWVGPPTLTHRALLSLEAQLARLLLRVTRCPDSNQPPLVFANQAKKYSGPKLRVAENRDFYWLSTPVVRVLSISK
jgi:hypothetical protein